MRHHHSCSPSRRLARGLLLFAWALASVSLGASAQTPARAASLDEILKRVSSYDGGIDSGAFWTLRDYVLVRKDEGAGRAECEAKLLQFLKTPATPSAKLAAARLLREIAADTAVPALQLLLRDERTADYALFVLQPLAGAAADKALVAAVATTNGATRTEVIAALGQRRTGEAVPVLVPLLEQPAFAVAAATSLGRIASDAATQALEAAYASAAGDLRRAEAGALLGCAEKALKAGNSAAASRIYERLSADAAAPGATRKAAAMGRIAAAGPRGGALLTELLGSADPVLQEAALARVKDVVAPGDIAAVCNLLGRLPERSKVQLLAVLASYPADAVRPTVMQAARGDALAIRLAALKTLETVGDASTLPFLLEAAARTRGPEQTAARDTIGNLKGRAVDEAVVTQLAATPAPEIQGELLLAVGARRIFRAKKWVSAGVAAPSGPLRTQALKALRVIGTPSDVPAVLDLLVKSEEGPERTEAEAAVAALAQKTLKTDARAAAVKARLADEKDPQARARLMAVLPLIGDPSTLPTLRKALDDANADVADAAVRGITSWPTSAARDDVLRLARDSKNETHRLLAIVGLVRLIEIDRHRDPVAAVSDLRYAAKLAWRPEEQRLVLGALAQFPCADALELAGGYLQDAALKPEAEAAIEKIKAKLK